MKRIPLLAGLFGLVFGPIAGVLFAIGMATHPAEAQSQQCGDRSRMVAMLAEEYGESPRAFGLTGQGQVVETFANGATGTWTITVTFPDGRTCLMASGSSFEELRDALPDPTGVPL